MKLLLFTLIHVALISSIAAQSTYDYCEVLQKSLLFYEAQRSGRLPPNNRVPWRGNSALLDCTTQPCPYDASGDGNLDGGYYDAGDSVKFMFPQAFALTTLSWGFIENKDAIEACGETQHYLNTISWGTDFLMKAHTAPNEFWAQVGNGGSDHAWWGPPERMDMSRPSYSINANKPGTDLALEAASALAAASIAFKTVSATYSAQLLVHARQLYTFGNAYLGKYSDSVPDAANYYSSYSYHDEQAWGASWMYRATGEASFLATARNLYASYGIANSAMGQSFDWDQKAPGVVLNMYKATGDAQYLNDAQRWMNSWFPGNGITYTPGGLAWLRQWGPLRYTAASAFLGLMVASTESNNWARGQINYILGSNPSQRSYVCGFGKNSPINPHHRAAHGSTNNNIFDPINNLHILTGALVGGPGFGDDYVDARTDYIKNEVALDYNAAFTGAIAGLAKLTGSRVSGSIPTPPISAATTRPTTAPTAAPTSAPTTAAPTAAPTTAAPTTAAPTTAAPTTAAPTTVAPTTRAPTTTAAPTAAPTTTGSIRVSISSSATDHWLAVAVRNGGAETAKVEVRDSGAYAAGFSACNSTNWGYFVFAPSAALSLKLPVSLRVTDVNGRQLQFDGIITSLTQNDVDTGAMYVAISTAAPTTAAPTPTKVTPTTAALTTAAPTTAVPTTTKVTSTTAAPTTSRAPTTAAPTTTPTTFATPTSTAPPATPTRLHVHEGSNDWWFAVAVIASSKSISVQVKDVKMGSFVDAVDQGWGYWLLPPNGNALQLPVTVQITLETGATSTFVVSTFTGGLVLTPVLLQ